VKMICRCYQICCTAIMLCTVSLHVKAQGFNVDAGGNFSTPPPDSYGCEAHQAGFWNPASAETILRDLAGVSTQVLFGSSYNGGFDLEIEGATLEDKLLMDSVLAVQVTSNAATFLNLQPGLYDLYIYCWAGNLLGPKDVTIRVFTGAGQVVGGVQYGEQWPGQQVLGETYDKLRVEVTPADGQYIDVFIQAPGDFNVINGIQLVPVPAPAGLLIPAAGALVTLRRRR
jgi:hypothetical protein